MQYLGALFSQRLSFGFDNPNAAAAVLAGLIPYLYLLGDSVSDTEISALGRSILAALLEIIVMAALVLTQSRAGIVGWLISTLIWVLFLKTKGRFIRLSIRCLFMVSMIFASSLSTRVTMVLEDASVHNRLKVWYESFSLLAAAPWTGWGKGAAGVSHFQWAQEITTQPYADMLNSYLQIAVDFGLPAALLLVFMMLLPYTGLLCRQRKENHLNNRFFNAGAASFTALAVCHFFSTIFIYPPVMCLTAGSYLLFLSSLYSQTTKRRLNRVLALSSISAVLMISLIFIVSKYISKHDDFGMQRTTNDLVIFSGGTGKHSVDIYVDEKVLGPAYGQVIRKALLRNRTKIRTVAVHTSKLTPPQFDDVHIVIGAQASRISKLIFNNAFVVNPSAPAEILSNCSIRNVFLPEYDINKVNESWEAMNYKVEYVKDSGQYMAADFENIMMLCCDDL